MEQRRLRAIHTILLLSLLLSFLLCAGATLAAFRHSSGRGSLSFAVLSVPDALPEADLLGLLGKSGIQNVISSADEWVYVDGFDALERVPLNQFSARIAPFDLRNDAYAARLAEVFASRGFRRVFIPAGMQPFWRYGETLLKRINTALEGYSPVVQSFGGANLALPYLVLFGLAALVLVFRAGSRRITAFSLPALGALAPAGALGFTLAALLYAMQRLFQDHIREFIRNRYARRSAPRSGLDRGLFVAGIGAAGIGLTAVLLGAVPPAVVLPAILSYAALTWISLWYEAILERRRGHVRFLPLALRREPLMSGGFFSPGLPLFLAAMIAFLLLTGFHPGSRDDAAQAALQSIGVSLSTSDYHRHLQHQAAFSVSAQTGDEVGGAGRPGAPVYRQYALDADGLVAAASAPVADPAYDTSRLPPLEALLWSDEAALRPVGYPWGELAAAGLSGLIVIAAAQKHVFTKKGKNLMTAPNDKRVAA